MNFDYFTRTLTLNEHEAKVVGFEFEPVELVEDAIGALKNILPVRRYCLVGLIQDQESYESYESSSSALRQFLDECADEIWLLDEMLDEVKQLDSLLEDEAMSLSIFRETVAEQEYQEGTDQIYEV